MKVHNVEQYSDDYWALKTGKISASKMSKLITTKGALSDQWKDQLYKIAAEKECGFYEETFSNSHTERGLELEDNAIKSFKFITQKEVSKVGIVEANHTPIICSPDGLGDNFGLEVKCPSAGVHLKYRHEKKLPTDYKHQVFTSLYICDQVDSWYFYSYHPDMKQNFICEITRESKEYQTYIMAIETYMPKFIDFMDGLRD